MFMQREALRPELVIEMLPLAAKHHVETGSFGNIELDIDWDLYEQAQRQGILRLFTLRKIDGYKLLGYANFFVRPAPHARGSIQAVQDVLFLHPDARHGWLAVQFLKFCDKLLQAEGVEIVYHHTKTMRSFGVLLERIGYHEVERIYARRLYGSDSGDHRGGDVRSGTARRHPEGGQVSADAADAATAGERGGDEGGGRTPTARTDHGRGTGAGLGPGAIAADSGVSVRNGTHPLGDDADGATGRESRRSDDTLGGLT